MSQKIEISELGCVLDGTGWVELRYTNQSVSS